MTAHAPWQEYVPTRNTQPPAFTRRNVYLRDSFTCQARVTGRLTLTLNLTPDSEPNPHPDANQYCNEPFPTKVLTYDHVVPVSKVRVRARARVRVIAVLEVGTCTHGTPRM